MTVHHEFSRADAFRALGFSRPPFASLGEPASAWPRPGVLRAVRDTLARGVGALAITGESGHGKTSLIGPLGIVLGRGFTVGVLPPGPEGDEVQRILAAFAPAGAAWPGPDARPALRDRLERRRREGRPCVLIVDDAHRASESVVSTLGALVGAGIEGEAPLRVVAMAPRKALGTSPMSVLPRVEVLAGPLRPEEAAAYVRHRLRVAGGPEDLFDDAAARELASASGGAPNALNRLAAACIEAAAAHGARSVGVDAVRAAAQAMGGAPSGAPGRGPRSRPARKAEPAAAPAAASSAHLWMSAGPDEFMFSPPLTPASAGGDRRASAGPRPAQPASGPAKSSAAALLGRIDLAGLARASSVEEECAPGGAPVREGLRAPGEPPAARGSSVVHAAGPVAARIASRGRAAASITCATIAGLVVGAGIGATLAPLGFAAGMEWLHLEAEPPLGVVASMGRDAAFPPRVLAAAPAEREPADVVIAVPPTPAAAPEREADARALYARGVALATEDPEAAVVAYARAALRGHARSARYLGQIYEIGDGVEASPALARAWYAFAEAGPEAARRGAAEGGPRSADRPSGAPAPMFSARMPDGAVELVWSGVGGEAGYRIELARDPLAKPVGAFDAAVSAARVTVPEDVAFWRVAAGDGAPESGWAAVGPPAAP